MSSNRSNGEMEMKEELILFSNPSEKQQLIRILPKHTTKNQNPCRNNPNGGPTGGAPGDWRVCRRPFYKYKYHTRSNPKKC
jgi:hypothetical protein